ncbi:DUF2304 family protein [Thermococcus sp.]
MYAVQYILIVAAVLLMIYILGKYGKGEFEWKDLIFWEGLLLVVLVIAVFPIEIAIEIKRLLGLGRGLDALFVVAIGLAYLMIFRMYLVIDRTEREITELTRKIAIEFEEINESLRRIEKSKKES